MKAKQYQSMLAILNVEGQEKRPEIGKRRDEPTIFTEVDSGEPNCRPFVTKRCKKQVGNRPVPIQLFSCSTA